MLVHKHANLVCGGIFRIINPYIIFLIELKPTSSRLKEKAPFPFKYFFIYLLFFILISKLNVYTHRVFQVPSIYKYKRIFPCCYLLGHGHFLVRYPNQLILKTIYMPHIPIIQCKGKRKGQTNWKRTHQKKKNQETKIAGKNNSIQIDHFQSIYYYNIIIKLQKRISQFNLFCSKNGHKTPNLKAVITFQSSLIQCLCKKTPSPCFLITPLFFIIFLINFCKSRVLKNAIQKLGAS